MNNILLCITIILALFGARFIWEFIEERYKWWKSIRKEINEMVSCEESKN